MNDQERVELFQQAVKRMEGFKRRGEEVCERSQHGDFAMIPDGLQDDFNETLKDFLQSGVDVEKIRHCFLSDGDFSTAGSGKHRYRGIPCSSLSSRADQALRAVEGFTPKAKGEAEASPS